LIYKLKQDILLWQEFKPKGTEAGKTIGFGEIGGTSLLSGFIIGLMWPNN